MKKEFQQLIKASGMEQCRWYHIVIIFWWVFSLFLMTAECASAWMYAGLLVNFFAATAAMRFVPIKGEE